MANWDFLLHILILLAAALLLGTLAEYLRQSAVLGYLLAGTLVGPHGLKFVPEGEHVVAAAELGVAMLLFSIGLEFSIQRLRKLGRIALVGGTAQVVVTLAVAGAVSLVMGASVRSALAIGAIVALSSTACVLRVLHERRGFDSVYGRYAIGVLLLQDVAVIPLVLLVATLASDGSIGQSILSMAKAMGLGVALFAALALLLNVVLPRLLNLEKWARNRELPVLMTVILALGSAYAAHAIGLSPALGAFVAGVLLGSSPYAPQIRADIGSLRTLLVTVFFASIGMLGDPLWALGHWSGLTVMVVVVVAGKTAIVAVILRMLGATTGVAIASGLCVSQVGEFSFVLAQMATGSGLIDADTFRLIVSVSIITLFFTPLLVAVAPRCADKIESWRRGRAPLKTEATQQPSHGLPMVILGFGPAGQAVAESLMSRYRDQIRIIELNPRGVAIARRFGLDVNQGDATHLEVLEEAGVEHARVIAITIPDPGAARKIILLCRQLAPSAAIVVRSRYHVHRWELEMAGARDVVDEEEQVGRRLAALSRRYMGVTAESSG